MPKELVNRWTFCTRAEARLVIRSWIEGWYNRRRLSSVLGYLSPTEWGEAHYRHTTAAVAA